MSSRKSDEELEEMLSRMPMFMDKMPSSGEPDEGMEALQALIDEEDPNELAANLKQSGNDAYSLGPSRFADAITYYTHALDKKPTNAVLIAQIYGNRAQVHLRLGNYGKCLEDAKQAVEHDPTNSKAYYRAAAACGQLRRFKDAMEWCIRGLRKAEDGKNEALEELMTKMKEKLQQQRKRERKERESRHQQILMKEQVRKACESRHIVFADQEEREAAAFSSNGFASKPYVDTEGKLHWPVLLLYPEHHTTDSIQDWHEDLTIGEMLLYVFAEKPHWDEEGDYSIDKIAVYYRAGEDSEDLLAVDLKWSLREVLQRPRFVVYQQTPALLITSKGNDFWTRDIERFIV